MESQICELQQDLIQFVRDVLFLFEPDVAWSNDAYNAYHQATDLISRYEAIAKAEGRE